MPEVNQYLFTHKELLEILIKQAGVHEGKWTIMTSFGFTAGNFGPSPGQMSPGAVVTVLQMGIQRAAPGAPEEMTADAAVINPLKGEPLK
jgi:hypothetical protein